MRQRWNCKSDSGADLLRERNRDTFGRSHSCAQLAKSTMRDGRANSTASLVRAAASTAAATARAARYPVM